MPAKKVGNDCLCKLRCFEKVGRENIDIIFTEFYKIGDNYTAKSGYLMNNIRDRPVKRRRQTDANKVSRTQWSYYVKHIAEYEVCRNAFMAIHAISNSKLKKVIQDKLNNPTGSPPADNRGRGVSGNTISGPDRALIHEHIQMLAVTQSHYSRAHSPHRRYMEMGMTQNLLHSNYVDWMTEKHPLMNPQKLSFYMSIFTKDYNIVRQPQQTDVCDFCSYSKTQMEIHKTNNKTIAELENDLTIHKAEAKKQQSLLSHFEKQSLADGPTHEWRTICIDLQQSLPCPRLNNQKAYYKTKIWLYNVCIFDLNRNQPTCFLWDETRALKGSNEINSCLLKWIELNKSDGFKKLRIFADNCVG